MASAVGMVLAAGGIAVANEAIFAPIANNKDFASTIKSDTNLWRIVPATAILAITLGGLEKIAPPFAKGIAGLVLLTILIVPFGNAPTPLENAAKAIGVK